MCRAGSYRIYRNEKTWISQCIFRLLLVNLIHGCFALDIHVPPLLRTPDGFVIDNTLQASEQDVRLEDFFWTGSGDGAPSFGRRPVKVPETDHHHHDIFIKTSTVVATIYVDESLDDGSDNLCLTDCEDNNIPRDYFPSDRRYWLLTVVSGFLNKNDFPIVEKKLAKLYRIAFSRQQSRHFGIENNNTVAEQHDELNGNRKRSVATTSTTIAPTSTSEATAAADNRTDMQFIEGDNDEPDSTLTSNEVIDFDQITTAPADYSMERDEIDDIIPFLTNSHDFTTTSSVRSRRGASAQLNNVVHRVSVLVHNISLASDNEENHPDNQVESLIQRTGAAKSDSPRNQTEIIYSVFVDGKPVLATTAADDMKLLSEQEVADVMQKMIYTKAEPYWKEPQATPLIPSMTTTMNGSHSASNQLAMIVQNPWMISILIASIIMLVFLLAGLLFMTRAKRIRSAEVKRLTSSRVLIGDDSTLEKSQRSKAKDAAGVDNLAYEKDGTANRTKAAKHHKKVGTPTLYFPRPPSTSPSSSNSDSMSSYYKTKTAAAENHVHLFNKRSKRVFDLEEYATVAKKHERKPKRTRHKRKLQNRVGSIEETAQIHSPQSSFVAAISDDAFDTSGEPDSHFYEHIEAFNPNVVSGNYHKNKLLSEQTFSERNALELDIDSPTEAYNREIMRALQRDNRLHDSLSVGSFLSMASIRSFPKYNLPQPLSRVLEPLSVTHLDQSDEPDTARLPRVVDTKRKHVDKVSQTATEDVREFQRSQSDGADPGVIGPVVWEIHKKKLEAQDSLSPLRDPFYTRNRFEGLLEGAIRMYSEDKRDHEPSSDVLGVTRPRDNRGKSAMVPRQKSLITPRTTTSILNRPLTAEPYSMHVENAPTQPPSPCKKAWASGAPSPLVRPLSAGPFHKPDPSSLGQPMENATTVTSTTQTTILSTAPLIEAIQTELRKFSRYDDSQ